MKVPLKIAALFLALSLSPHGGVCQERAEDALNGYAIHATYRDLTIVFYPMRGRKRQGTIGFTPEALNIKRATKDAERVSYIRIDASLQGKLWRVEVAVQFGEFYDSELEQIAAYHIREGEKAGVKEVARYGLKPFDVSVVRVERVPAVQPEVVNRTNSIVVLSVKTAPLPMPYRVVLKNTSGKAVQALEIVASNGKGAFVLYRPEGTPFQSLIEPGQERTVEISSEREYQSLPTSEYLAEQLSLVEINTAVFADSTYEGQPDLAVWQKAKAAGDKIQIDRILLLIQSALETEDDAYALEELKKAVSSLGETVEPALLEELNNQFQGLSQSQEETVRGLMRRSLHDLKAGLNRSIADFESGAGRPADGSFKAWLESKKEAYESWRSRLPQH